MYRIEFIPEKNRSTIVPLLGQLDSSIPIKTIKERLEEMFSGGYQCVGIYDGTRLIGISGLWILTKYYIGRHVEPDNVYILPEYQGQGLGALLMEWIFKYSKSIGCVGSELNCYVNNIDGQKFWESQGYQVLAYHYQKKY